MCQALNVPLTLARAGSRRMLDSVALSQLHQSPFVFFFFFFCMGPPSPIPILTAAAPPLV